MDVHKIVAELYEERERLDAAIGAIEALAAHGKRPRGRPPKWLAEARAEPSTAKKKGAKNSKPKKK